MGLFNNNCFYFLWWALISDHASRVYVFLCSLAHRQKHHSVFFLLSSLEWEFPWFTRPSLIHIHCYGSSQFRLARKFLKSSYQGFQSQSLAATQIRMLNDPSMANVETKLHLHKKWHVLSSAEEKFLFQRSKVTWLQVGDHNTPYFHHITSTRLTINHIHYLED